MSNIIVIILMITFFYAMYLYTILMMMRISRRMRMGMMGIMRDED